MSMISAGEQVRFYCEGCEKEFEVLYEPKAKGDPAAKKMIEPDDVSFCPFCGEEGTLECV